MMRINTKRVLVMGMLIAIVTYISPAPHAMATDRLMQSELVVFAALTRSSSRDSATTCWNKNSKA